MRDGATAIWQGFDFGWRRTPHRLNQLGSWLDGLTCDGASARGLAAARLTVGRVPDRGVARVHRTELAAPGIRCVDGEVKVDLRGAPGEGVTVRADAVRAPLGGADPDASTVVLRGFDLVCTSHSAGVHPQGLGVRLADVHAEGDALSFVPELFLRANHSPDPLTFWRGCYAFRARVLYTVILADRGALARTLASTPCATIRHGSESPRPAPHTIQGRVGYGTGVLGLRGFRFDQLHEGRFRRDGRYLRRFHAFVGGSVWDPRTARLTWEPMTWFSNAGVVAYPLRAEHKLWTTLLQPRDDRPQRSRVVEHEVTTGFDGEVRASPF